VPTKTFKFGDGVLDKKPNIYGPVGITVDNSFFDNAAECFLFTKCNLNGCSRMSDAEIAKIKPKIPDVDGNILDSNGKPQHISSGGVKSIIDAIVRIFIKIFGFLLEQIVQFVECLFKLNYTVLIKTPLDIASMTYCSTPATINPPGIAFANGIKFSKDMKDQQKNIKALKDMLTKFKKMITDLPGFINEKIVEPTKSVNFDIPPIPMPFLGPTGKKPVIPGNDSYKQTASLPKHKFGDKGKVNIFDLSNIKVGNKTVDLDLASLLLNPFKELKKIIPNIQEPDLKIVTVDLKEPTPGTITTNNYLDQFEEFPEDASGNTSFNEQNFLNKWEQIKKTKKSNIQICPYTFSGTTQTSPFTFFNDLLSINIPDSYTESTTIGGEKLQTHTIEDTKRFLVDTIVKSNLLQNGDFVTGLINWIDSYKDNINDSYNTTTIVYSSLKQYIKSCSDNFRDWKNYTINSITIKDLFKYSLDLFNLGFYKNISDFDIVAFDFMFNIDNSDKTRLGDFQSIVKIYSDIFQHFQDCNLLNNSTFKNLIRYPDEIETPDIPTVSPPPLNLGKNKDFIPGKVTSILTLVEFIKQIVLFPVNLILKIIKQFLTLIKKLVSLNVAGVLSDVTKFLSSIPTMITKLGGTLNTIFVDILNGLGINNFGGKSSAPKVKKDFKELKTNKSPGNTINTILKIIDMVTVCLPTLIIKTIKILIHKFFLCVKFMLNYYLKNVWLPNLSTYMAVTTFPGTTGFITLLTGVVTGIITSIDVIIGKNFSELVIA